MAQLPKMPPLMFCTGIAHVSDLGPNVVISFSGFEQGDGQANVLPITHRIVLSREALAQGLEFLKNWMDGIKQAAPVVQ